MSILKNLRILARYNVLTPVSVLAAFAAGPALAVDIVNPPGTTVSNVDVDADDTFTNNGTVDNADNTNGPAIGSSGPGTITAITNNGVVTATGNGNGVGLDRNLTTFINNGSVTSAGNSAFGTNQGIYIGNFTNDGDMSGAGYNALFFGGGVGSFLNDVNGTITNTTRLAPTVQGGDYGGAAIGFNTDTGTGGVVTGFVNKGTITAADDQDPGHLNPTIGFFSQDYDAINNPLATGNAHQVGAFWNSGTITGDGTGIAFDGGVGVFDNVAGGSIVSTMDRGINANGPVGTFANGGAITAFETGVAFQGSVDSFGNLDGGTITSTDGGDGVFFSSNGGQLGSFVNDGSITGYYVGVLLNGGVAIFENGGTITGGEAAGVYAANPVGSFTNLAGGMISSTDGQGASFDTTVDSFVNDGAIESASNSSNSGNGTHFWNTVGTFTNSAGATISGGHNGVRFDGNVGSFLNAGDIIGTNNNGVEFNFGMTVTNFANSGKIQGDSQYGIYMDGQIASFTNLAGGMISGRNGVGGVLSIDTFANAGSIVATNFNAVSGSIRSFSNSGLLSSAGSDAAILFDSDSFVNTGTISAPTAAGVVFYDGVASATNSGIIRGNSTSIGMLSTSSDRLSILTGSELYGAVSFGAGDDTFDFSGFYGTAVIGVAGLEAVVAGDRPYAVAPLGGGSNGIGLDANGDGGIAIFDPTGVTSIGGTTGNVVGAIQSAIGGQLGGSGGSLPGSVMVDAFAPEPDLGEAANATAVMSELDVGAPADMKLWGATFGGLSRDAAPVDLASLYGGLVIGAHTAIAEQHTLGALAAYARSTSRIANGQQTITSDTGVVGGYGQSDLGVVKLDYALLGGASSHASSRDVVVLNTLETLTGTFSSWFLAPSVGITVPVLADSGTEVNLAASASYIFGGVSGYTEQSASLSIGVGPQSIGIFEGRLEINGKVAVAATDAGDVTLRGKAGLLAQANLGGSTLPITFAGGGVSATTSYTAPGATAYGGYAGMGLTVPVATGVDINLDMGGTALNNGTLSGHASAGISGSF